MNITIRINTDSTAFEGRTREETTDITQRITNYWRSFSIKDMVIFDSNGQVCGSVEVQESPETFEDLKIRVKKHLIGKVQESEVK